MVLKPHKRITVELPPRLKVPAHVLTFKGKHMSLADQIEITVRDRVRKLAELLDRSGWYEDSPAQNILDLLVDVRHYCDAHGIRLEHILDRSYACYLEEKRLGVQMANPEPDFEKNATKP